MTATIRKIAQNTRTALNFCVVPWCLHATKNPKCSCCRKGCGSKKGRKR